MKNNKSIRLGLNKQENQMRLTKQNGHQKLENRVRLRKVKKEDSIFLFNLRNQPLVIESSFKDEPVDLVTHTGNSLFDCSIKFHLVVSPITK